MDPIQKANEVATYLKRNKSCDMVICLSHLGNKYTENNLISDEILSKESENIDLIIGGHTHSFLNEPIIYKNRNGDDVIVNQVGYAGIILGRLDFEFSKFSGKKLFKNHNISVSQKTVG